MIVLCLNLDNIREAFTFTEYAKNAGIRFVEVDDLLIKSHGIRAISEIANSFPSIEVIADMKILDQGDRIVELAAKAGASMIEICGNAHNSTIMRAKEKSETLNIELIADMIGVRNLIRRSVELEHLGIDHILLHRGVDEQEDGTKPVLQILQKVRNNVKTKLGVAGGIKKEDIPKLIASGADMIFIGRYITQAHDPLETLLNLSRMIHQIP